MKPLNLSQAVDVVAKMVQRGPRRPHWYDSPVQDLIAEVGDLAITQVTPEDIAAWHDGLRVRPHQRDSSRTLSPWTVDSYGRAIRSFFNHLVEAGLLADSPAAQLRLPRLPPKQKKAISDGDLDRMIQASEYNARDHAIVLMLRDTGVRVGELCSMVVDNVQLNDDRGRVLVTDDKTHVTRFAYFGARTAEAVSRYLRSRPYDAPGALWLSHRAGHPLTTSGVYQALERIADRAGVRERWNPHAFRHSLARRLLESGMNHVAVQRILGHADVVTTLSMYVQYDDDELAQAYFRAVDGDDSAR